MSLVNVSNLTFAYDGSYDNIFEHATFQLDTNWRLGLIGRNGRGKTTLLKLLQGKYEYAGTISASASFDYFPYSVHDSEWNTIEVLEAIDPELEVWRICKELAALELNEELLYRPYSTLSNGEQAKMLLAALFLRKGNFFLIDEPTNHLDLEGRQVVSHTCQKRRDLFCYLMTESFWMAVWTTFFP